MSVVYKVWVQIEACDFSRGTYKNVSPYPVCIGEFASVTDADLVIEKLTGDSSITPKVLIKNKLIN